MTPATALPVTLPITLIVAADRLDGIARDGDLPWHLPHDLSRFKRLTIGQGRSAVLMGRATWDTLPPKWQPLPRRRNIVMTRGSGTFVGAHTVATWDEALAAAQGCDHLWVVGGAQIYTLALAHPEATAIELTRIAEDYGCDVRWPGVPEDFVLVASEPHVHEGVGFVYERWERRGGTSQVSGESA